MPENPVDKRMQMSKRKKTCKRKRLSKRRKMCNRKQLSEEKQKMQKDVRKFASRLFLKGGHSFFRHAFVHEWLRMLIIR